MTSLAERIKEAGQTTNPKKALKAVRWVLQSEDGRFATLNGITCEVTESIDKAQVFDGRDNEELKARFWTAQLGVKVTSSLL